MAFKKLELEPGFYVVRIPYRGSGSRLILESVCFSTLNPEARRDANDWCEFIQGQHPKDDVFVMEK